jgi:hypothetical protein
MPEPKYVDPDDPWGDDTPKKRQPAKKLVDPEKRTKLQNDALKATGRYKHGFAGNKELERFQALEALAAGADPESRVWHAWLEHCIEVIGKLNAGSIKAPLANLMAFMENELKRQIWMTDNRARVLARKSAQEIAKSVGGMKTAADKLEREMGKRRHRED